MAEEEVLPVSQPVNNSSDESSPPTIEAPQEEIPAIQPAEAAATGEEREIEEGYEEVYEDPEDGVVVEYNEESNSPKDGVQKELISNFKGYIKERGTRKPLTDITLYIEGTPYTAVSDRKGHFEFYSLPPAEYKINVPTLDYEKFQTDEIVVEGQITEVTYYLEPKVYGTLEVVVRGKKIQKEVSRKVIKMDEARVIAGTQGDAVKVVENMPGVARGSASTMGVVVRGSNAEDSRVLLDGHQIPLLFHFGGYKSVYNSDLLNEINLYTGGFGAEYGNATGGIVELKSRKPRLDRWGGYVDSSLVDFTAMVEGPITKDIGFAFSFRRSVIDLIFLAMPKSEELEFTTLPVYYDYQNKWYFKLNDENTITIDWYGGLDKLKLVSAGISDGVPESNGQVGFKTMFHSIFMHYNYKTDRFESDFSPGFTYGVIDVEFGGDYFFRLDLYGLDVREDMRLKVTDNNTLVFGMQLEPGWASISSSFSRPPKEGDVQFSFSNSEKVAVSTTKGELTSGMYVKDEMTFGRVQFIPGVRFEHNTNMEEYAISPRANIRYNVIDPLTLKAAVGLYHRVPDPDERYEPYGNSGLDYEYSVHTVGGLEWDITENINVDVQGYYKYQGNLVNAIDDTTASSSDKYYDNGADGYTYGGEILLRHDFANNFFGWISYSISRSMRNDGPGTPYRLFDIDQTHNLTVVASYNFLKTWTIGGRFRFSSGEPYTDILGSIYNSDNGTYIPLYNSDKKNQKRSPPFHQLDLRLDKKWVFNTWILHTYLDVQSVYYHANPVGVVYNYDYTEQGYLKMLPILPSIGIKAEF